MEETWRNEKNGVSNPSQSDAQLVLAARRGDKKAFVEIVARHQAMVCGVAFGILSDFAASEDAAQEAFLTAWRRIHDLREPEKLRSWLGQIARHAALGHLRKRRGHQSLDEEAFERADESPLPHENACQEEEAELVRASLQQLPETYRLPLSLYYRDGQSVRGVAETLGISEDAVKQRLARGREMLRDQVCGVIERVLTKTGPTPIFTMTIAAAIGALITPAAIAGTVFAATATTTAVGSSTSSLLTAMSTSKPLLITAAVVGTLCIPVGYHFGNTEPRSAKLEQVATYTNSTNKTATKPSFEDTVLFAEWRHLHEVHGTNAQAMPKLYAAIKAIPDTFRRRAFRAALISEWVQVDPQGGLIFMMGDNGPDSTQRRQFFEEWLAKDPAAALNTLMSGNSGWYRIARECLSEIARKAPDHLPAILDKLPQVSTSFWDTRVRDAVGILAERNLVSAKDAAEKLTGPNRQNALMGVALGWAKRDLNGAITWAKSLPEGVDRDEIIRAALIGRAATDPISALNQLSIVPPGTRSSYFASSTGGRVLREAVKTDFEGTVAWVTENISRLGHEDLMGLSDAVEERLNKDATGFLNTYSDSKSLVALTASIHSALLNDAAGQATAVWQWLSEQPDSDTIKALRENVLRAASSKDPESVMSMIAELPSTPSNEKLVASVAMNMAHEANRSMRLDDLINKAPPILQRHLLKNAFNTLDPANFAEPNKWLERLGQIPDADKPGAAVNLARSWAVHSPADAVNWATSLEPGGTRAGVVEAISRSWAARDVQGAANWLGSFPPGTERDGGVNAFVMTIAQNHPREALQWAATIGDQNIRKRSSLIALGALGRQQPEAARQWIDQSSLPPNEKAELHTALSNHHNHTPAPRQVILPQ